MLYAIGDIHGMRDELAELLAKLPLEPSDRLIFIGDYVDRGRQFAVLARGLAASASGPSAAGTLPEASGAR